MIDVKEIAKIRSDKYEQKTKEISAMRCDDKEKSAAWEEFTVADEIDLIRAVIADERQPEPSTTKPDVPDEQMPEYVRAAAADCWGGGTRSDYRKKIYKNCEAEIARRVAEATAQINGLIRERDVLCQQLADAATKFNPELWVVALSNYKHERNARLAADRRAAELQEIVKTQYLETRTGVGIFQPRAAGNVTEVQFAEALAAFRSRQEGVKQ